MKVFWSIFFLFLVSPAHAEFYKCDFTEPFGNVYLGTNVKVMTVSFVGHPAYTGKNIYMKQDAQSIMAVLHYDEGTELKKDILRIDLTKEGSNGMSDHIYPFEASLEKFGTTLWGGCETESQPAKCPVDGGC